MTCVLCTNPVQSVQILSPLYLFKYVQIKMSHYIAMFVALLWFCTRLLCASLPTHQSCVKDTLASSLNMHFFQISNVSEITFVIFIHLNSPHRSYSRTALFFLFLFSFPSARVEQVEILS